jgi:predicted ATPase/DNA-binding CsgD family transcriptional regulator
LVVLDNCEHVVDGAANLATAILEGALAASVLATSRELLGVPGEVAWRVPSMTAPSLAARRVADLEAFDAVMLFLERARQARPNLVLDDHGAAHVVTICARLEGIPLAIELAAARVRSLSLDRLAGGLNDAFRLLTGGARTVLPRQQTLFASIGWSDDLLDADERAVFHRFAVFVADFDLDAAEAVGCGPEVDAWQVLDVVSRLVDKSLVQLDEDTGRHRLLDTIRQFALDRLRDDGDVVGARTRHANWYTGLVSRAAPGGFIDSDHAVAALDAAGPDLSAGLEWSLATDAEHALSTLGAMAHYFLGGNRSLNVDEWVQRVTAEEIPRRLPWARAISALASSASPVLWKGLVGVVDEAHSTAEDHGDAVTVLRCRLWRAYGQLATRGDVDDMAAVFEDAAAAGPAAVEVASGAALELGAHLATYGRVTEAKRQLAAARAVTQRLNRASADIIIQVADLRCLHLLGRYDAALALFESTLCETPLGRRQAALPMAWLALDRADRQLATDLLANLTDGADDHPVTVEYIVPTLQAVCDVLDGNISAASERLTSMLARPLVLWLRLPLGEMATHCAMSLGDRVAATSTLEPLAVRATAAHSPYYEGSVAVLRALLACGDNDPTGAEERLHATLPVVHAEGLVPLTVNALEALGCAAASRGHAAAAARLITVADTRRQRIGYTWRWPHQRDALHRAIALTERDLQPDQLVAARQSAADLDLDTAVAVAQRRRGRRGRPSHGWHSLTPTELEVTKLVGDGLSNRTIAERLLISEATVRSHLNHVYSKLDISNRSRLVIAAHRRQPDAADAHP